jgi:hypothetical protein
MRSIGAAVGETVESDDQKGLRQSQGEASLRSTMNQCSSSCIVRMASFTTIAAWLVTFGVGCSKHSSPQSSHLPPNKIDLGVVDLSGGKIQEFTFGDGMGCILTGTMLPEGLKVDIEMVVTNTDGTVEIHHAGISGITHLLDDPYSFGNATRTVIVRPTWKAQ